MLQARKGLVKTTEKKEDRLLVYSAKIQRFYGQYARAIIYVIGALIVLAIVAGVLVWSKKTEERNAAFAELMARDAFSRGDIDSTLSRANLILDQYPGTTSAAVALMLKGRAHEQRGEFDDAEWAYRELLRKYSEYEYLGYGAHKALGAILNGRGDFAAAGEEFLAAATKYPNVFDAPNALIDAGKNFEKASRYDDAKRAYLMVVKKYSKSRSVDEARRNLTALEFMR